MPKEVLQFENDNDRIGPAEVYVTLRDLIALQYEAHGFSFLPKYAVQSILSGRHRSKLRGRGLDFEEVRQYVSGDDIRNIDWKVTARVGVTHTKVFTEEKERPVMFIVDQSASMFYGSIKYMKSVIAAQLAAVGCWRVLDVGDRVGGIVFNDSKIDYVSPKRDRRSVQRYLGFVTQQNQQLSATKIESALENPLNKSLEQACEVVSHDFLVIVISDFNRADHKTLKLLIRLKKNNDVVVARISDPSENSLSQEKITMSDGEFQTRIDKDNKVRKQFQMERHKYWQEMSEGFKKYSIPLLDFHTSEEPIVQLRSMLSDKSRR